MGVNCVNKQNKKNKTKTPKVHVSCHSQPLKYTGTVMYPVLDNSGILWLQNCVRLLLFYHLASKDCLQKTNQRHQAGNNKLTDELHIMATKIMKSIFFLTSDEQLMIAVLLIPFFFFFHQQCVNNGDI